MECQKLLSEFRPPIKPWTLRDTCKTSGLA